MRSVIITIGVQSTREGKERGWGGSPPVLVLAGGGVPQSRPAHGYPFPIPHPPGQDQDRGTPACPPSPAPPHPSPPPSHPTPSPPPIPTPPICRGSACTFYHWPRFWTEAVSLLQSRRKTVLFLEKPPLRFYFQLTLPFMN